MHSAAGAKTNLSKAECNALKAIAAALADESAERIAKAAKSKDR